MKPSEWLDVCGAVTDLWPAQPWSQNTATTAFELFQGISAEAAREAVKRLAAEGREFVPPPGVLLQHALAVEATLRPALIDPDLTRDLTPEEQERATRRIAEIKQRVNELAQSKSLETPGEIRVKLPHSDLPKTKAVDDSQHKAAITQPSAE